MAWYDDFNVVLYLIINIVVFAVGAVRRKLLYPVAGLGAAALGYNYITNNSDVDITLAFLLFLLAHLAVLVYSLVER